MKRRSFILRSIGAGLAITGAAVASRAAKAKAEFEHPYYSEEEPYIGFHGATDESLLEADGDCLNGVHTERKDRLHYHTTRTLTPEELETADSSRTYLLLSGFHRHKFSITDEQFAALKAGEEVILYNYDHGKARAHVIALRC